MDERAQTLRAIEGLLAGIRADRVLIGGLAVGFHGHERGTQDVDMLVHRRALKAIAAAAKRLGFDVLATSDLVRIYPKGGKIEDSFADLVAEEATPYFVRLSRRRSLASFSGSTSTSCDAGHSSP